MVYGEGKLPSVAKREEVWFWGHIVQVTATETAETLKIGQYMCTGYDLTPKSETVSSAPLRYWVTKDVDSGVAMSPACQMARSMPLPELAEAVAKLPGFPIRWVAVLTPDHPVVFTITTIRKEDIPDSLFEVPADYRKVEAP
jgi:hypothetical protein